MLPLLLYSKLITIKDTDMKIEVINNTITNKEARRLILYSESRYNKGLYEDAINTLEALKQYNNSPELLSKVYLLLSKSHYMNRYKYIKTDTFWKNTYLYLAERDKYLHGNGYSNADLLKALKYSVDGIDLFYDSSVNKKREYHKVLINILEKETDFIKERFKELHSDEVFKGSIEVLYFSTYKYIIKQLGLVKFNKKELKQLKSIYSKFLKLINKDRIIKIKKTDSEDFFTSFEGIVFHCGLLDKINMTKAYLISIFVNDLIKKGYVYKNYFTFLSKKSKIVNHYETPFKTIEYKNYYDTIIEGLNIKFMYRVENQNCHFRYWYKKVGSRQHQCKDNRWYYREEIDYFGDKNCYSMEIDVEFNYSDILKETVVDFNKIHPWINAKKNSFKL